MGVSPIDAPNVPTYVELEFVKGVPVSLNGEKMSAKNIILKLNEIGGANGIGINDIVENSDQVTKGKKLLQEWPKNKNEIVKRKDGSIVVKDDKKGKGRK